MDEQHCWALAKPALLTLFPLRLGNSKDNVNLLLVSLEYLLTGTGQAWIKDDKQGPGYFLSSCADWMFLLLS